MRWTQKLQGSISWQAIGIFPWDQEQLAFNLAGNYTIENERDGAVKNPQIIAEADQSVIDATQEALIFTSRPEYKAILGIEFALGKFNFSVNNTLFGSTKFRKSGMDSNLQMEFRPKVVTDIGIGYQASDNVNITFNANNIFDVLPKWKFVALYPEGQAILNNPRGRRFNRILLLSINVILR